MNKVKQALAPLAAGVEVSLQPMQVTLTEAKADFEALKAAVENAGKLDHHYPDGVFSDWCDSRCGQQNANSVCPCLGTVFELLMRTVTVVEDLGMVAIVAVMLVFSH